MPHPKNRVKMTGDTHLPDMDLAPSAEDEALALQVEAPNYDAPRTYADGYVPGSQFEALAGADTSIKEVAVEKLGEKTARSPWLVLGSALAVGYLIAKMIRR